MADFNVPVNSSAYASVLGWIKDRAADIATWMDSRRSAPTNIPDYSKRWNDTAKVFENWLTGAWAAIVLGVAGGGTGAATAADARTNLGAAAAADLTAHSDNTTTAHGAVSAATASKIVVRDASGRAAFAAPSAAGDAAILSTVTDHAGLTNPHSAASAATASRIVLRDASGRAKFAAPSASDDAAINSTVTDHSGNTTTAHGAVSAATASKIVVRDASGRAAFAAPSAAGDAATKGYVDGLLSYLSLTGYKNLVIKTVADHASVDIDADYILLMDTSGNMKMVSAVNLTVNLDTSAAANGRDAGSVAANQGWFLWVINNGSTTAGLASASASAPTMPAGYTYNALVGWCTTDATATPFNIEEFTQIDDEYIWTVPQKVVDAFTSSANTQTLSLSSTGIAGYAVAPSLAKVALGKAYINGGTGLYLHPVTFADSRTVNSASTLYELGMQYGWATGLPYRMPLVESQTFYWQLDSGGGTATIWVSGFTLKR